MTWREKKEQWERMGFCTMCGGLQLDPAYKTCAKCRSKRRERELRNKYATFPDEPKLEKRTVSNDHKCWTCEWGRFEGDRFFCPFVEGTCVKEKTT